MCTSSRPTSMGAAPSIRCWRSAEASQRWASARLVEALQDHPVDLQRRAGRQQPLLDEAGEAVNEVAGLALPAREVVGALGPHAGLRDDADASAVAMRSWLGRQLGEQPVRRERQVGEAHAGRVGQRVGDRRRHRVDAALALGLGAERPDRVDACRRRRCRCAACRRRPGCGSCAAAGSPCGPRRGPCSRSAPSRSPWRRRHRAGRGTAWG